MQHYIYIIRSLRDRKYYKGYSTNPRKRLDEHNLGKSRYTSNHGIWELVYIEILNTKKESLIKEKAIKKYSTSQIEFLLESEKNIIGKP